MIKGHSFTTYAENRGLTRSNTNKIPGLRITCSKDSQEIGIHSWSLVVRETSAREDIQKRIVVTGDDFLLRFAPGGSEKRRQRQSPLQILNSNRSQATASQNEKIHFSI